MKKLYKQTATGSTQVWYQEISENGDSYRTISGKLGGKMVFSEWTTCIKKNIGKANETSLQQQCLLEVEANYKKKLAQGNYKDTLDENLSIDNYFKPMLAKEYGKDYDLWDLDCKKGIIFSQSKFDGLRLIIKKDGMWSRQGKEIISAPHIFEALKPIFEENPDVVFDGELYSDRLSDNFNEIISLARKTKPTKEDIEKSKQYLQYWIYDFPQNKPFQQRYKNAEALIRSFGFNEEHPFIKMVPTVCVDSKEHLDSLYASYMEDGFEGQMVRISNAGYENKRSKQLLKRKEFFDEEFVVEDIVEGIGNRSGMAGRVEARTKDGKVFGANIKGTRELYRDLLAQKDKYIGTLVTIKYQELTPDGIPRFGVATKFLGTTTREI